LGMSNIHPVGRDSDASDRLADANVVLLRQEPDEEEDEEEDDRKEEDDDDEGDGYSE